MPWVHSSQISGPAALCAPFVGSAIRGQPFDEGCHRQGKARIRTPGGGLARHRQAHGEHGPRGCGRKRGGRGGPIRGCCLCGSGSVDRHECCDGARRCRYCFEGAASADRRGGGSRRAEIPEARHGVDRPAAAVAVPGRYRRLRRRRDRRVRHRTLAANYACAGDGCSLLPGQPRRLQSRARGCR